VKVERKLKAKSADVVEALQIVVTSSRVNDFEQTGSSAKEQRKKEASKPLYLTRYE